MKRTTFVCTMIILLALVIVGGMAQGSGGCKGPGMAAAWDWAAYVEWALVWARTAPAVHFRSSLLHQAGNSVCKCKTYYFCCPTFKPEFDKNPEKYAGTNKKSRLQPGITASETKGTGGKYSPCLFHINLLTKMLNRVSIQEIRLT